MPIHLRSPSRLSLLPLLAFAVACAADSEPADTDSATATEASSSGDATEASSSGDATEASSSGDATDTDADTADTGATDTGVPEGCDPPDASTRVDVVVDIGDFPAELDGSSYSIADVPCTVAAVDPMLVETRLDCEAAAGTIHAVSVRHAASDLGAPAWAAGDAALLSVDYVISELSGIPDVVLALRSTEGEPWLLVIDRDSLSTDLAAPFELSLDADACPGGDAEETRGILSVTLDDVTAMVVDAGDGTLQTDAGTWAVELEQALSGFFGETNLLFELLVMKVQ